MHDAATPSMPKTYFTNSSLAEQDKLDAAAGLGSRGAGLIVAHV